MVGDPAAMDDGDLVGAVERWESEHAERLAPGEAGGETLSGIDVRALYTPLDLPSSSKSYLERIGLPGEPPYTRGVVPGGYRERLWVMGQYSGVASAS